MNPQTPITDSTDSKDKSKPKLEPADIKMLLIFHAILIPALIVHYIMMNLMFGSACTINALTGLMCPLCGMTRAHLAAFRLDFAAAFSYNALFPLGIPFLASLMYYPLISKFIGKAAKWPPIIMGSLLLIYCIVRQIFGF